MGPPWLQWERENFRWHPWGQKSRNAEFCTKSFWHHEFVIASPIICSYLNPLTCLDFPTNDHLLETEALINDAPHQKLYRIQTRFNITPQLSGMHIWHQTHVETFIIVLRKSCIRRLNFLLKLSPTDCRADRLLLLCLYRQLVRAKCDYRIPSSLAEQIMYIITIT